MYICLKYIVQPQRAYTIPEIVVHCQTLTFAVKVQKNLLTQNAEAFMKDVMKQWFQMKEHAIPQKSTVKQQNACIISIKAATLHK